MVPYGVLHVPHSSLIIPSDLRKNLRISDEALDRELLRLTDRYTDELFALPPSEAVTIRFPVSRLVLDPERFLDDSLEPMAERGMGVIYTSNTDLESLRDEPSSKQRQALIQRFYEPHHAALTRAVQASLEHHERCLVLDCHSFPSRPLPFELDQDPNRSEICIGTDDYHTRPWLLDMSKKLITDRGLTVEVDRPFSGALVPQKHFKKDDRVLALMIEVNRSLYMDENSGEKLPGFQRVAQMIQETALTLLHTSRSHSLKV